MLPFIGIVLDVDVVPTIKDGSVLFVSSLTDIMFDITKTVPRRSNLFAEAGDSCTCDCDCVLQYHTGFFAFISLPPPFQAAKIK